MKKIELTNVSVEYNLLQGSRNKFFPPFFEKPKPPKIKAAINKISVKIGERERVGLLGKNGSGKTTLLKVLSGILRPTSGECECVGSVGCLFTNIPFVNYNLSPRENVKQFAEYSGMTESQKDELTKDIEDFTELREYFDQPLSYGSTGMVTRFNFALLTSEPKDILVIDEGIGAGDQFFREKAEARLDNLYSKASILIIASHSKELITRFCSRALILDNGAVVFDGTCKDAYAKYNKL